MSHKSIFQANFEESLNLEDDGFRKLHQEQHDKTIKYFQNGQVSLWFRVRSFIYALIFSIGLNFLVLILTMTLYIDKDDLSLPIARDSFLTVEVFFILLFIWLLLVLIGKMIKPIYLLPYRYQFHVFTTMIWLYIELDLAAFNIILPVFTIWGAMAIVAFIVLLIYKFVKFEIQSLNQLMYGKSVQQVFRNKMATNIATYGLGILSIGIVFRVILSLFSTTFLSSLQVLGLFIVWLALNIGAVATLIFIGIPYFLQAYYKLKYPEDYRLWEGKTLEEWYGKKYLKKHKELLNDES